MESKPHELGRRPTCLVATLGDASRLQRVARMIHVFNSHGYVVDLLGLTPEGPLPVRRVISLDDDTGTRSRSATWIARMRRALATLSPRPKNLEGYLARRWMPRDGLTWSDSSTYDVVVFENIELFPLIQVVQGRNRSYWISELRDFYWNSKGNGIQFWLHDFRQRVLYRRFLPQVDDIITVSQAQRGDLLDRLNLDSHVIRSLPTRHTIAPSPVCGDRIELLYHGIIHRERSIHLLIQVMKHLDDRFTLDLYSPTQSESSRYLEALKRKSRSDNRIRFHEAINYEFLLEKTSQFDLGLALMPPTTSKMKGALPNKFFEYIQARLGVVVGPSSEMSSYVRRYGLGVVTDDFTPKGIAATLNALNADDIHAFKRHADAASAELCFEIEQSEYGKLMEKIRAPRKKANPR
mgnify:FL=1